MLQLRVVYGVLPWKKLLFNKNKQKNPTPSPLPTKNTIQENCKQNSNDAQIWPRVVLPDFKGIKWTLFGRNKYLPIIYQRTILDQKGGIMAGKKTQKKEKHSLRGREKQDGCGKAEDGVCKRRHGPMCVRLLFKMEEALLFLTEKHEKRKWGMDLLQNNQAIQQLWNEIQWDNTILKKKAKNQKYKTQTSETIY